MAHQISFKSVLISLSSRLYSLLFQVILIKHENWYVVLNDDAVLDKSVRYWNIYQCVWYQTVWFCQNCAEFMHNINSVRIWTMTFFWKCDVRWHEQYPHDEQSSPARYTIRLLEWPDTKFYNPKTEGAVNI